MQPTVDIIESCFALPIIAADGEEHPTLILLTWSPATTLYYALQVYVDGELRDVVTRPGTDRLLLRLDRGKGAVIELIAVDILDPWAERPPGLSNYIIPPIRNLSIEGFRDPAPYPPDVSLAVRIEGKTRMMKPVWPEDAARPGFGVTWGTDDFGFGMAVGPGFGLTEHATGPFGCGGSKLREKLPLEAGVSQQVEVCLLNRGGEIVSSEPVNEEVQLYEVPQPVRDLQPSGGFAVTWTGQST